MKKVYLIYILLVLFSIPIFSQISPDTITIKKAFGGCTFYQNDKRLNWSKLAETLKSNDIAYDQIKKAKRNNGFISVAAFSAGAMIGWQTGQASSGGDPNWLIAGAGGAMIIAIIPLSIRINKQAKAAVDEYNRGIRNDFIKKDLDITIGITNNGVGLTMNF